MQAALEVSDREHEEHVEASRAAYEKSCVESGGEAWAAAQLESWTLPTGTSCAKPDEQFLEAQEAKKKIAKRAAARRAYAAGLDEWALEHGAPDDKFFTSDQVGGEPDAILVYRTVLCSRQRVRKVINDLTRAKLKSLGFARVYCEHTILDQEWWEAP